MNNQELEKKVQELLQINNFFDMILAVKDFEKEYKNSDFYKTTKMPLFDVIKNAKVWYLMNLTSLIQNLQQIINNLDLTKLTEIIEQLGGVFETENEELRRLSEGFLELMN